MYSGQRLRQSYVVLRVDEGAGSSANRGRSLRALIGDQHLLGRPPTLAEREALGAPFGSPIRTNVQRASGATVLPGERTSAKRRIR